ncbi:MAG: hypothetical protein CL912_21855 [Deltaproteobacteria bacterium]|nr:hypothetical protein [Deltaproteobacteria bacterium]
MVESAAASNPPQPPPTAQVRPPTPPRESSRNELNLGKGKGSKPGVLGDLTRFFKVDSNRRASAPVTSTSAVETLVQTPGSASGSGRKRVGWSDSTQYKDPPTASFDGKNIRHIVQPLAPSSERKPPKSILKISSNGVHEKDHIGGVNTKLLPPHHHASFATMLDSIVQQLGGKDRSSKMDAYLMFSGLLKASDNVPDLKALKSRMGLLCQFLIQDVTEKMENGKSDTGLVVNALVLLSSFLQKQAISDMFTAEFSVQVVDHAIKSFEDASAPKEIIKHLMFIMAQQNFSPKVMTADRVGKLIKSLHNIENHIKGKSITMSRISIYRTLLRSSRSHMIGISTWYEDLFGDMLSSLREVRTVAIAFGFEAAIALGAEPNATKAVMNMFKLIPVKQSYGDFYADRLKIMVKNKNDWDSSAVPQIWSIVILFLRSTPEALGQWQFLNKFLEVIQLSFNSSDSATKTEANLAWNRFIYALQLDENTKPKCRTIISHALITQLKTRKSSSGRRTCLNSIYMLLYYSLKPESSSAQLELYWDEYVIPIIDGCLTSARTRTDPNLAKQDALEACVILQSLFDSKTPRKWKESRAVVSLQPTSMDPSELPALDSKWLRRNSVRVFKVLNPLMEMLFWDLGSDSGINRLWRSYMASIGSPAVNEIMIKPETMSSLASMFSMLHRFWLKGGEKLESLPLPETTTTVQRTTAFTRSFENIVLTAASLDGLQLAPFTDKLLSIAQDTFVAVATPSHLPAKQQVEIRCPLHHLILLLTNPSPGMEYDQQFRRMVEHILSPFIQARPNRSLVELICTLSHLLPSESNERSRIIWQVLAEFATTANDTRDSNVRTGEEPLGSKYRKTIKILEIGVNLFPGVPSPAWGHLFQAAINSATLDAGDSGRAIGVIEEVAKIFLPKVPSDSLTSKGMFYLSLTLKKANYPKDKQALELAHRKLWGTGTTHQKSTSHDPYVYLYQYVNATLTTSYKSYSKDYLQECSENISALTGFLGRCPTSLLLAVLIKIQPGIEHWILDNDQRLLGGDILSKGVCTYLIQNTDHSLTLQVASLWDMVKKLMPGLLALYGHTEVLRELNPLICAGLNSRHGSRVSGTLLFWNSSFGSCDEPFEYPENVKQALLRLRAIADVQIPYLPESIDEESSADQRQPIDFMETQDDSYGMSSIPNESIMRLMRQSTPQVIIESRQTVSLKRSWDNTPGSSRRKSRKRDVTPKIRHDDSQVQFETVESSPMADRVVDSQLLTDKQKETKERQQAEQSMFPDLRSTPISREKSAGRSDEAGMELPNRQSSQLRTKPSEERQTTPTLPIPSDDDGYVASSPTPTRSIRGEPEVDAEIDPPSSPPVAPARKAVYVESNSPSLEHTPEPATEATPATTAFEPEEINDIPSSPPESTPEQADVMDVDGEALEEQADLLVETTGHVHDMDLDPTAEVDEEQLELPEHEASSKDDEPGSTNEANLGHSAQVDSFANITMSTFEFTPEVRHSSPVEDDPSEQLRASQREEQLKSSIEDDDDIHPSTAPAPATKDEPEDEPAHRPQRLQTIPLLDPLPPGTPQHPGSSPVHFMDAQSSPASSDRQDVFVDAVSSPRLTRAKEAAPNPSTPDDYGTGNDSSFLRAVHAYDQSNTVAKDVSFVGQSDNSPRRSTRGSASKPLETPSSIDPSPIRKLALKRTSNLPEAGPSNKEPVSTTSGNKSSSIPSFIPETPGMPVPAEPIVDEDGQQIDPEDTIVVDTSSLKHWRPTAKRGKRKGRKRKHHETSGDSNEIPDSQDAMAGSESKCSTPELWELRLIETASSPQKMSPSKQSPAKKKPRGRPSRASQVSQQESDVESSQGFGSQSMSVDLDAQHQEMDVDGTTMSFASNAEVEEEETAPAEEPEVEQSFEGSVVERGAEIEIEKSFAKETQEDVDMDAAGADEATSPSFDVIEETTIDETSLLEKSSPAVEQINNIDEKAVIHPAEMPIAASSAPDTVAEPVEASPIVEVQVRVEEQPVTAESMADKLQSLLKDLQSAALSRQEVNKLEDLFFEAKRHMYAAEERGRASADGER